jgi:hypothetical protein
MSSSPKKSEKDMMMSTMVVQQGWRPENHQYKSLRDFFPFYMSQHANRTCRRLHFIGTTLGLVLAVVAVLTQTWWLLAVAIVQGYAWAWVGHFGFEHNKPATFKYPWLSYLGDWKMWWQMLTGKIAW